MTPADPTPENPLPLPDVNTIPGQDPVAAMPEEGSPGYRNQTRPLPLHPATQPAFAATVPPRREIPLCCWVAVISSLTSVVLAALLWMRTTPTPAPPAASAPTAGTPVQAPPVAAPAAPGTAAVVPPALKPYADAAAAGDTSAMRMMGAMYYHGLDLPRNRAEGLKWYRKAAESGSKVAKEELKQLE